jgi:Ras-related protein Rab-1A
MAMASSDSPTPDQEYDHIFRLFIFGDDCVGKSSLILRFGDDAYSPEHMFHLGVDFKSRILSVGENRIKVLAFDNNYGKMRCVSSTPSIYRQVHGFLLCYDVACASSFKSLQEYLDEIAKHGRETAPVLVVGTKCDLTSSRQVSLEEGQAFAESRGLLFMETSAKDNINVREAYELLAEAMLQRECPPPIVFTLMDVKTSQSSVLLTLATLSGEAFDVNLEKEWNVLEARRAVAQVRAANLAAVRLVTSDGMMLEDTDVVPGCAADSPTRRCILQ